ncbi:hypothetical protein [Lysobacter sp. Root983]|uniref:hypothetical protein n=1 Tax=Lysobacter sp. Root983 TaxID=1736613 RepID=UPI0012FA56D1|nr:hypothetical protein [Lysobacter sp. Root983]
MKPFTTIETLRNGKFKFLAQIEGVTRERIAQELAGESVVSYRVPNGQSLESVWFLQLFLRSGLVVEITASSTQVENWQEFGTININICEGAKQSKLEGVMVGVESFEIEGVNLLLHEDEKYLIESGIVLRSSQAKEIMVAAGEYPGSLTVQAPFSGGGFEPQFPDAYHMGALL